MTAKMQNTFRARSPHFSGILKKVMRLARASGFLFFIGVTSVGCARLTHYRVFSSKSALKRYHFLRRMSNKKGQKQKTVAAQPRTCDRFPGSVQRLRLKYPSQLPFFWTCSGSACGSINSFVFSCSHGEHIEQFYLLFALAFELGLQHGDLIFENRNDSGASVHSPILFRGVRCRIPIRPTLFRWVTLGIPVVSRAIHGWRIELPVEPFEFCGINDLLPLGISR